MLNCSQPNKKPKILIPCFKTIRDLLDPLSSMNFSTKVMFEIIAQEESKSTNQNMCAYRTSPIGNALMNIFDDLWAANANKSAKDALAMLYSALKPWTFESTLSVQESVFEKAKIFLQDMEEVTVISNDTNIEAARKSIIKQDANFDYGNINVQNTDTWLIEQLRNKNPTLALIITEKIKNRDSEFFKNLFKLENSFGKK